MAYATSFRKELDKLFRLRTHALRTELGKAWIGKPPRFDRKKLNKGIKKLQEIASGALAGWLAKKEFDAHVAHRKNYMIKGRGRSTKRELFERWFTQNFPKTKGLIYAFWGRHGKCIYIGRTGSKGKRPSLHFDKIWLPQVHRVQIFAIKGKSHLPKLECLAIHHFRPSENRNKAANKKWSKACPLCKTHGYIKTEVRRIFRLK